MKKYKILLLIILFFTFFSTTLPVKAVTGMPNHNGTLFLTSPTAVFADNTNNQLTPIDTIFSNTSKAYLSNTQITLNGANDYGAAIVFDALQPFVAGYTYTVSILISLDPLLTDVFPKFSTSGTRVCVAENLSNTITRYNLRNSFPCSTAQMYYISGTSPTYNTVDSSGNNTSRQYGLLTYIFTPDFTGTSVVFNFQSSSRITNSIAFGGYAMEVLSDNKTGASSGQVQSIINNSGLASADSVEEVQEEIANVKQDINTASNEIVNSNNQTQDVIKDQFNDCRSSLNLLDLKNGTYTLNGVTAVVKDGVITLNGTATDTTFLPITLNSNYDVPDGEPFTVSANNPVANLDSKIRINVTGYYDTSLNISNKVATYIKNSDYDFITNRFQLRIQSGAILKNFIIKPQIQLGSIATNWEPFGEEVCTNRIDETNNQLDNLNQSINNNNVNGVEGAFESFEGFISENSTITQLITMPITLYSSILNGLQSTCQPFVLGNLFGTTLTIPCINIGNYLGSSLWSMIDIIISGFAIFSISKKFIKIFNNFSSMKEGDIIDD